MMGGYVDDEEEDEEDDDGGSGSEPETVYSDDGVVPARLGHFLEAWDAGLPTPPDRIIRGRAHRNQPSNALLGSSTSPRQLVNPQAGRNPRLPPASNGRLADPTPVLDLTDSNSDDEDVGPAVGSGATSLSTLPALTNGNSAASISINGGSGTFTREQKGKGKARAVSTPPPPPSAAGPSLATLTCPVCLGPPTPLALTACGHAFCAPCLHASLVAGPALTPPPPDLGPGTRGNRGGGGVGGAATSRIFVHSRGRGRGGRGRGRGAWVETGNAPPAPPGELDKHCPVCRHPLRGGVSAIPLLLWLLVGKVDNEADPSRRLLSAVGQEFTRPRHSHGAGQEGGRFSRRLQGRAGVVRVLRRAGARGRGRRMALGGRRSTARAEAD